MTVKGKRAAALRKLEYADVSRFTMGGIVDESFQTEPVHNALGPALQVVDCAEFDSFFGGRLGTFRMMEDSRNDRPAIADELILIQEAMDSIEQVRLRLEHLPPTTESHINMVCWKARKEMFFNFARRLDPELRLAWMMLATTEQQLEPLKNQRGRKSSSQRDRFLHDVAVYLAEQGIGKEAAAATAAAVLRAVKVDAPDDPSKARAIVRKVEGPKKEAD